jgi:ubiquinone/menaquinone biosynthesis C-methylase UbiE
MGANEYILSAAELREYHELQQTFWWFVGRRAIVEDLLQRFGASTPRPQILDVGCGTGLTLRSLKTTGLAVGLDVSENVLQYSRKEVSTSLICANATSLPFASGSFDVVLALDVLEHISDERLILGEIRRVLRAGGLTLVTVPAFSWLWTELDTLGGHYRRYTLGELGRSLAAAGFKVEKLSYFNFFLFPALVLERMMKKLTRPPLRAYIPRLPRIIDRTFRSFLGMESVLLRKIDLPIGGSVVAVARQTLPFQTTTLSDSISG